MDEAKNQDFPAPPRRPPFNAPSPGHETMDCGADEYLAAWITLSMELKPRVVRGFHYSASLVDASNRDHTIVREGPHRN